MLFKGVGVTDHKVMSHTFSNFVGRIRIERLLITKDESKGDFDIHAMFCLLFQFHVVDRSDLLILMIDGVIDLNEPDEELLNM